MTAFERVLYIDIDVHHGDGVEEAFYNTNRVFTLSVHQFDQEKNFFPGTGNFDSDGVGEGKYHALNIPLKAGCTDSKFKEIFGDVFPKVLQLYKP